jgi:hypothetical protein
MHDVQASPLNMSLLKPLEELDWENTALVELTTAPILLEIAEDVERLARSMELVLNTPSLFERCESNEIFHRVILYQHPSNLFSIRLLSMCILDRDIVHNHRATFATLVLASGYRHSLYRSLLEPNDFLGENFDFHDLSLITSGKIVERTERPGSLYALHHSALHSTRPFERHLSLNIRGPSVLRKRLVLDPAKHSPETVDGGSDQQGPRRVDRRMQTDVLQSFIGQVRALDTSFLKNIDGV